MPPVLYLVDASVFIFRAYYSVPIDLTDRDGNPINAVHGFARFLGDLLERETPGHVAVAFDESLEQSYRNEIYPQYKANRDPAPPELKRQFALCREVVRALGIAEYGSSRYEADDIIGTLAALGRREGQAGHDREPRQGPDAARHRARHLLGCRRRRPLRVRRHRGALRRGPGAHGGLPRADGRRRRQHPRRAGRRAQDRGDAAQALQHARGRVRESRCRAEAQVPRRELRRAEPARASRTRLPVASADRHCVRHAAGGGARRSAPQAAGPRGS